MLAEIIMTNGLVITDLGVMGVIVETSEPFYTAAKARHAELQAAVDQLPDLSAACLLVLRVIAEGLALHRATLEAMTAVGSSRMYKCGLAIEIELSMGGGWLDRRQLPEPVVDSIRANRGCEVSRKDGAAAESAIRHVPCYADASSPIDAAIADARAWWYPMIPGPLFAHLTRSRPFQALDREARARMLSRRPQRGAAPNVDAMVTSTLQAYEKCFAQTGDMSVINKLVREFGRIARLKASKPKGRDDMMEWAQSSIPGALLAGRAQMLVVGGVVSVLVHGGVRGKPLAPISMYEYSRQHLVGLTADLAQAGVDNRSGQQWLSTYREMTKKVLPSQQGKLASFLEAFHLFLVLAGMERLPASILGQRTPTPPAAAIVTDHELGLALASQP